MGFKVKVAERSGTSIKNMFPLISLWEGSKCGRSNCVLCGQEGEEVQNYKTVKRGGLSMKMYALNTTQMGGRRKP